VIDTTCGGRFESFAFDRRGLVPVSPLVELAFMTTKAGKAFLRDAVRLHTAGNFGRAANPFVPPGSSWSCGVYAVPASLRARCPDDEVWVGADPAGRIILLFPSERRSIECRIRRRS